MRTLRNLALLFLLAGGALQAASLADPQIGLNPLSFTFDVPKGGPNPPLQKLAITNIGTGQLDWTATVGNYLPAGATGWLSLGQLGVSTASGKLSPNQTVNIDVLVNVGVLDGGTYTSKITVTGPAGVVTKTSDVQMRVSAVPRMEATPTAFTFAAPENGANPPSQTLTVKNTGSGILDWSFVVNQSWVQLSPAPQDLGPAATQDVQVQVLTGNLLPGLHQAKITLSAPGLSDLQIDVNFTINANPAIGVSPTSLTFDAPQGGPNPSAKQFSVKNEGGGTLVWSVTDDATWLTLNPTGGSLASGQSQVVTVSADVLVPTNLVESTYLATVSVAGTNQATGLPVSNSPQTIGVTLNVNSIPTIGLNPQSLSFTLATDLAASAPAAVSITNTGSGTLTWSATNPVSWLTVSPGGGSLSTLSSQPLQVTAIPFGLAPGVYTTNVQITASGASNSPRNVAVELTVTPSSLPTTAPAGQCGLLGLDMLALIVLLRSLKSRGGSSCTSR